MKRPNTAGFGRESDVSNVFELFCAAYTHKHNHCLEPKEFPQLVWSEESKWKVDQPEQEAQYPNQLYFGGELENATHKASKPADVMPTLSGIRFGMSV